MSENEVIEDDAAEMIGESIQEQQELDTIRKLETVSYTHLRAHETLR